MLTFFSQHPVIAFLALNNCALWVTLWLDMFSVRIVWRKG